METLTYSLRKNKYIENVSFIDGTKILANANEYSFVWRKNTVHFDKLNRKAIVELLNELNDAKYLKQISDDSDISLDTLDEIIIHLENCLNDLNDKIESQPQISPNPYKQKHRKIKSIENSVFVEINNWNMQIVIKYWPTVIVILKPIMMLLLCELRKILC